MASIEQIQSFYIDYLRSFVLVPWMQRQCPLVLTQFSTEGPHSVYMRRLPETGRTKRKTDGLVVFGFSSHLKQYFSLYLAGCLHRGERRET